MDMIDFLCSDPHVLLTPLDLLLIFQYKVPSLVKIQEIKEVCPLYLQSHHYESRHLMTLFLARDAYPFQRQRRIFTSADKHRRYSGFVYSYQMGNSFE